MYITLFFCYFIKFYERYVIISLKKKSSKFIISTTRDVQNDCGRCFKILKAISTPKIPRLTAQTQTRLPDDQHFIENRKGKVFTNFRALTVLQKNCKYYCGTSV